MNLFGYSIKAAPPRKPGDDPSKGSILQRFSTIWKRSANYAEVITAEKAMQHPTTYRCLDKVGTTFQSIRLYVGRDPDADSSIRTTKKMMRQIESVLNDPCDDMDASGLKYWMALSWAAFGRIPLKIGVAAQGGPNAIYPLFAGKTEAQYNTAGELYEYTYGNGQGASRFPSRNKAEKGDDGYPKASFGYEINRPALIGAGPKCTRNNTPLNAIGLPSDVIMMLLKRAHDTASGHPNSKYIVATEANLTAPQQDELKEEMNDRKVDEEESGNVLILSNTKIQVEKLDNDLSDIHSKLPLDDMSRMICGAFGIPVALVGFAGADGSKFANNYVESRRSFFEDTMIPGYAIPICDGLTKALCPPGYKVFPDIDSIPALQEARAKMAKDLTPVDFLTINEKREICGWPKHADGDRFADPKINTAATQPGVEGTEEDDVTD